MLVAGLWPFHHPKNDVTWLENENGLRFGHHATVFSAGTFEAPTGDDETSYSLEIWVEPDLPWNSSTLLAFHSPENPVEFSLRQSNGALELQSHAHSRAPQSRVSRLYVNNVFPHRKHVFITVTSGAQQTAIYLNGVLVRSSRDFQLSTESLDGQMVLGTSPVESDSWSGRLRGLAIYGSELKAADVLRHYQTWTKAGQPDIAPSERIAALYLFDEHAGNVVHGRIGSGLDLHIPYRYVLVDQILLERPWQEFEPSWRYCKDVLINIAGFIPLGFFFYAYLLSTLQIKRAAITTVIFGAALSLTIEVLQAFLPTRFSGTTDLITNTLGTWVGVKLYGFGPARNLFARALNGVSAAVVLFLRLAGAAPAS